ncbi:MAG: hypothetical protein EOO60_11090 [Hymenobacter sp.]|nr:MAG: hypothetical protein EOO60_11090 [Hymenobacter sp.]
MPSESTHTLLTDESFLNYCFERDEAAVRYWQAQLLHSSPARQATIRQAKALALLLAAEAARTETNSQYQLLRERLGRPRSS